MRLARRRQHEDIGCLKILLDLIGRFDETHAIALSCRRGVGLNPARQ